MNKKVLIIGSGIAGLTAALRLAKRGYQVEIVEKNAQAGGRLNQLKKDGFTFDLGPSFFSMTYEFEEFARDCKIEMPFRFIELDPLYSVHFEGNPKTYRLYKDIHKLAEQFKEEEPDFEAKMEKYLKKCAQLFDDTVDVVIKSNFDSVFDYLMHLIKVNPAHITVLFRNFYQQVRLHFSSKEVRQILSLVAFFLGRTPFDTMAIYTLLSHTEFRHNGYYNVEGGMYSIVEGLLLELEKENVQINYNTEIISYKENKGKLEHFIDNRGQNWKADLYLVNGDAAVFRGKVLDRKQFSTKKLDKMSWTMGYLTFYLGVKTKLPQVDHHNYYLGSNFEDYARNVQQDPGSLQKPYYYVNVVSKYNKECAPEGCESLFFVCPVPNLLQKPDWSDKDSIVNSIIEDFSIRIGQDIKPAIVSKTVFTPLDWEKQFHLHRGTGLGLSHKMLQIGGFRPANVDEKFRNVFYAGASTVPGAGLPMGVISSKLAVDRMLNYKAD